MAVFVLLACDKSPYVVTNIVNSCYPPERMEYELLNDQIKNEKIKDLIETWPTELREYLHAKMQNRIIQNANCDFKVMEWESYGNCLLSLISQKGEN